MLLFSAKRWRASNVFAFIKEHCATASSKNKTKYNQCEVTRTGGCSLEHPIFNHDKWIDLRPDTLTLLVSSVEHNYLAFFSPASGVVLGISDWRQGRSPEAPFLFSGDILFNYGPGTQYPRVSGASSLFTGNLAYSVWGGAQGEGEVEDQSRGHRVRG